MRRHWRMLLLGLVAVYLLGVGVVVFGHLRKPPEVFSSPTASRRGTAFEKGTLGILEPASKSADLDWPAEVEMAIPVRIPGDSQSAILDWDGEGEVEKETSPTRWVSELEGDDEIELVAFATWTPQPDDDVSDEADWKAPAVLRDPKSLNVFSEEDLDAMGVPEEFRMLTPPKEYGMPKLRLLLRSRSMEYVRCIDGDGGDARTGAIVTYNLDSLGEEEPMSATIGEWTRVDMALLVWHDVPVEIQLQILTGEPEIAELEQEMGAQVAFGDRLRIQWLETFDGDIDIDRNLRSFTPAVDVPDELKKMLEGRLDPYSNSDPYLVGTSLQPPESDPEPGVLVRTSSRDFLLEHCGWLRPDEETVQWEWDRIGENGQIQLATIEGELKPGQPMKLVFLPKIAELTFELAGMPDQPNSAGLIDLFDVNIPRLTLPKDTDSAEQHLLGVIGVAAEVEFELEHLWEKLPAGLPADRTFRNQTPRELMIWYLDNTRGSWVRFDQMEFEIFFNENSGTWWERIQEWLSDQGWIF